MDDHEWMLWTYAGMLHTEFSEKPVLCHQCGYALFPMLERDGKTYHYNPAPVLVRMSKEDGSFPMIWPNAICPKCKTENRIAQKPKRAAPPSPLNATPPSALTLDDPHAFEAAANLSTSYRSQAASIQTQPFREIAETFVANVDRLISIALFAPLCVGLVEKDERHRELANGSLQEDDRRAAFEHYAASVALYESPLSEDTKTEALKSGYPRIASFTRQHQELNPAIGAIFYSQVVGAWTAFETLTGDLWEAAVNSRPSLASKISNNVQVNMLEKYQYNVVNKMGTILRGSASSGARFTSLEEIRKAYECFEHADTIVKILGERSFDALSVSRNLIVHKAGKCDQEYKKRCHGLQQLPQLELNEPLVLNGELIKNLIGPPIDSASHLTQSVYTWLMNHPE